MRLYTILVIVFVLMGLVGGLGGTYYYYLQLNDIFGQKAIDTLEVSVDLRADYIGRILKEQGDAMRAISKDHHFADALNYTTSDPDLAEILKSSEKKYIHDKGGDHGLQVMQNNLYGGLYKLFLVNASGISILDSDVNEELGKDFSDHDFFINGKEGLYFQDVELGKDGRQRITISHPIVFGNESFIGMIVGRIDTYPLDEILTERAEFGETGESYLINENKLMITPSRFIDDTFLYQEVITTSSSNCFEYYDSRRFDGSEAVENYRGDFVFSAYRHIPQMNWCLFAEISEEEVLRGGRRGFIKTSIFNIVAIFLFFSFVGIIVARLVSRPIGELTKKVDEITKGKLDIQLEKSGIYEIQLLIDSLNRVLASLKLAIQKTKVKQMGFPITHKYGELKTLGKDVKNQKKAGDAKKKKASNEKNN